MSSPLLLPQLSLPTSFNLNVAAAGAFAVSAGPVNLSASFAFSESFGFNLPQLPSWNPCQCYCPEPPPPAPPPCDLQVGPDGKIHTPGGYTIEVEGNTNWKITGPDGKCTRVHGDPHVSESDGGKWDFKRDSSFVLPDGTRINVKTSPTGNGMTVTSGLEIVNGNERVQVDGVNTGHPQTSQVQHTGQQWNTAGWDQFVMGSETDDWAFGGREIVGSENGGEVLKVGDPLAPGHCPTPTPTPGPGPTPCPPPLPNYLQQMIAAIQQMLSLLSQLLPVCPPPAPIYA